MGKIAPSGVSSVGNQLPTAHQVAVCLLNPGIQQVRALSGRTLHDDAAVCPHRDIVIAISSGIMVPPVELPRAHASATTGPLTTLTTITLSPHHDKCLALVRMGNLNPTPVAPRDSAVPLPDWMRCAGRGIVRFVRCGLESLESWEKGRYCCGAAPNPCRRCASRCCGYISLRGLPPRHTTCSLLAAGTLRGEGRKRDISRARGDCRGLIRDVSGVTICQVKHNIISTKKNIYRMQSCCCC